MKINRSKPQSHKIKYITAIIVVVSILTTGLIISELLKITDIVKNPFYKSSTQDIQLNETDEANKNDSSIIDKSSLTTNPNVDETKNTSEIQVAESGSIALTQIFQENGFIGYKATISNDLPDGGTCTSVFTNSNSKPITRTVSANSHVCEVYDISEMEFSQIGTWQLSVRYFTDNSQVTTTGSIEIR